MSKLLDSTTKIQSNGTSKYIVLPKTFCDLAELDRGDEVVVEISKNMEIKIKKLK